mmetsp:Transcript_24868/g.18806  ORF Transcript_24868/g.18806 Transcript_24868/m.18806 type:complete len:125 (-) Transcript_24868:65-439(-)
MLASRLFVVVVVLLLAIGSFGIPESFSQRRRRTKELEEKITKLDDGTKQRIFAMKASGMPHDSIADKISYQAGGKTTAKRIVDAMLDDPITRKPATKKNTNLNPNTNNNKKSSNFAKNKKPNKK